MSREQGAGSREQGTPTNNAEEITKPCDAQISWEQGARGAERRRGQRGGSREQGAGSREQEAGSREQGTPTNNAEEITKTCDAQISGGQGAVGSRGSIQRAGRR